MSPQFVDFDADGQLDIVAGTFDGSPHLARGSAQGWLAPQQILDRTGSRIVLDQFWNFDKKQWDRASRKAGEEFVLGGGHATSAIAFDWDGDGDLDLLLGDHTSGHVYLRRNDGTAQQAAFGKENVELQADGKPLDVPGTVATLRLVDWNRDGLQDLACSGMGDAFQDGEGGGVYVYLNTGSKTAPSFGAPITLVERSQKGAAGPVRPDSGLYMDFADHDGDGDLDLVVGGYSQWRPAAPELTEEQRAVVARCKADLDKLNERMGKLSKAMLAATQGLEGEAAAAKRSEVYKAQEPDHKAIGAERARLTKELEPLQPSAKRESFVWLYENTTPSGK